MTKRMQSVELHHFAGRESKTLGKIPGDNIGCALTIRHKGAGGVCYVSWGIAPGTDWPGQHRERQIQWVVNRATISLGIDADWKSYAKALIGKFPEISPGEGSLEGNFFDCFVVVEMGTKAVADVWTDDVYFREDRVKVHIEKVTATFS